MANGMTTTPDIVDQTYQSIKRIQVVLLSLSVLLIVVTTYLSLTDDAEFVIAIAMLVAVVMLLFGLFFEKRVRNRSGQTIMPLLCDYVGGLTYQRHSGFPNGFLEWGLIPTGSNRWAQDRIGGTKDGSRFAIWDVDVRSGTKNQVGLFKGFLIEITDLNPDIRFVVHEQKDGLLENLKSFFGRDPDSTKDAPSSTVAHGARYAISVLDTKTRLSKVEAHIRAMAEELPKGARLEVVAQAHGRARIVVSTIYDPF